jgi:hypothetical protein
MTFIKQPPVGPRERPTDGDLDGLLHKFFRAQMPDPWPAWQSPERSPTAQRRSAAGGRTLRVGRAVLAASLLVLLIGQLAFTRLAPEARPGQAADPADSRELEATRPQIGSPQPRPPRLPAPARGAIDAGKQPGQ